MQFVIEDTIDKFPAKTSKGNLPYFMIKPSNEVSQIFKSLDSILDSKFKNYKTKNLSKVPHFKVNIPFNKKNNKIKMNIMVHGKNIIGSCDSIDTLKKYMSSGTKVTYNITLYKLYVNVQKKSANYNFICDSISLIPPNIIRKVPQIRNREVYDVDDEIKDYLEREINFVPFISNVNKFLEVRKLTSDFYFRTPYIILSKYGVPINDLYNKTEIDLANKGFILPDDPKQPECTKVKNFLNKLDKYLERNLFKKDPTYDYNSLIKNNDKLLQAKIPINKVGKLDINIFEETTKAKKKIEVYTMSDLRKIIGFKDAVRLTLKLNNGYKLKNKFTFGSTLKVQSIEFIKRETINEIGFDKYKEFINRTQFTFL